MSASEDCLPAYPPQFTYPQVRAIVIAALKRKPLPSIKDTLNSGRESPADLNVRRMIDRHVCDRTHREQLRIWAWCHDDVIEGEGRRGRPRLSFQEASFREQCRARGEGWSRDTALRNIEKAITMLLIVMNQSPKKA